MKVNFADEIKKDEQEFDLGGDYFKFEEGPNRIRICSPMVGYESVFKDKVTGEEKTNVRFVTIVLDRKTNKVKTAFLPYTIKKAVADYQQDPEYTFEEVPMPYDITVNADGAGLKRKYSLTPARQNTPLTPEELTAVKEAGDVYDIVKKLKEKQGDTSSGNAGTVEVAQEAMPFPTEEHSTERTPADIVKDAAARATGKPAPDFLK